MHHRDGHVVWTLAQGRILEWTPEGDPLKMWGTLHDITHRKRMEQDLWLAASVLAARGAHPSVVLEGEGGGRGLAGAVARGWSLHTGLVLDRVAAAAHDGLRVEFVPGPGPGGGGRLALDADLAVVCRRAKPAYDIPYQLGVDLRLDTAGGGFLPPGCTGHGWSTTIPAGPEVVFAGEAAGETPETVLARAGEAS